MKNLFEYRTKYTLEEVTNTLGLAIKNSLKEFKTCKFVKVMVIGRKILVKGNRLNAEIWLDTNGVHDNYEVIRVKIVETQTQKSENHVVVRLNDKKYGYREDLKGAHYWGNSQTFYAYVPDFNLIVKDITEYLEFIEIFN